VVRKRRKTPLSSINLKLWGLGFLGYKKKERKEREGGQKEKKNTPFLHKPKIMHSSFFLISCSIDKQG